MLRATIEYRFEAQEHAKVNDRRLARNVVFMFMADGVVILLFVLIVIIGIYDHDSTFRLSVTRTDVHPFPGRGGSGPVGSHSAASRGFP